ncbi:MAG TPA: hypothetical protein PKD09_23280 [Aggregatilinea sp.]|uniref:hypothetical protein n=1 Tax=Aggregatilinea sp. TaxID=2806333 RepID=UPI002B5659BA|nr:hypothetical protein [Aggregatilinea sp.]HML24595.1 hypothetical protein [Aggregatilinea sp.]
MEFIRAAHNLTIELSPTTWRLFNGSLKSDPPDAVISLMEAREGHITCSPAFAKARRLPEDGQLEPEDIARIVVGWAPESGNWHLGLLLNGDPENGSAVRWCGLASWPSGAASESVTQAKLAGQSLARIIDRPFRLVPPKGMDGTLQRTQPVQPTDRMEPSAVRVVTPVAPQAPPFQFDGWRMAVGKQGYVWMRPDRWVVTAAVKIVGYLVLAALFVFLGARSQTSGLADVNPGWLPWAGIVVGIVLAVLAVRLLWKLITLSDVLINATAREVLCRSRMGRVVWRVPFDAAQYVLISQTPAHPEGRTKAQRGVEYDPVDTPMRIAQDVWIHIYDGQAFRQVAALEHVEGLSHTWSGVQIAQKTPGRRRVALEDYDTPAHHAARLLATTLNTDLWLDLA